MLNEFMTKAEQTKWLKMASIDEVRSRLYDLRESISALKGNMKEVKAEYTMRRKQAEDKRLLNKTNKEL